MKQRIIAGVLSLTFMLCTMLSLSGCSMTATAANLMEGITPDTVNTDINLTGDDLEAMSAFTVSLFQNSTSAAENTLVSPLSVLCALAMTANGAKAETLTQMEEAFGLSVPALNDYLHTYLNSLPSGDKYKVSVADSIWFKDNKSLTVERAFLQTNADYYGASVYKAAFDDDTLKDINTWVSDNTDGRIKSILDKIPDNAVMYLINALAFDADWENIYNETQVQDGTFTTASGETRDVALMHSTEEMYLDDGSATGFIKYYADRKYAFAALLPDGDVSIANYVAALTGDALTHTLNNAQSVEVNTAIPKFESAYAVEMSDILKSMGMTDAFDGNLADFTALGKSANGNIFISRVLHKTYIAVDEKGTKAGAATVVEAVDRGSSLENLKTVYLDRPFVYMLIDCKTSLPIFIGTMMDTGA